MIKVVKLTKETKGVGLDLFSEAEYLRSRGGKVYQTYVTSPPDRWYTIVTTSKDIHLELGLLSEDGLRLLCYLLDEYFNVNTRVLLFTIGRKGGEDNQRLVLITKSESSEHVRCVYHFSPA